MFLLFRYVLRLLRARKGGAASDGDATTVTDRDEATPAPARGRSSPTGRSAAARGPLALLLHQTRYDLITSLRNPRARFFTFFFPIIILVIFTGVFGHGTTVIDGVRVKLSRFYVPGILAMSIVIAAYANTVVAIATSRETGVLKRRRATPVPPAVLIAGQAIATVATVAIMGTLLLVIARLAYGVGFAPGALVALIITAIVGSLAFSCVGYAVSGLVGSPEAAQPLVQATMLPLWFISGVFIPDANLSHGLKSLARVFPVEHVANSLHLASVNSSFSGSISVSDLLVLAAWGVAAAAFAAWRFSWLPSTATA